MGAAEGSRFQEARRGLTGLAMFVGWWILTDYKGEDEDEDPPSLEALRGWTLSASLIEARFGRQMPPEPEGRAACTALLNQSYSAWRPTL